MTVAELIEKLKEFDQNALVVVQDTYNNMDLQEIETFGYVPTREGKTLAINAEYFDEPAPE